MPELIHPELSYQIRGALLEVYKGLGPLLQEAYYRDAIAYELQIRGLACERERPFQLFYEDAQVGLYYVDLWVEHGKILIELKVAPQIEPVHQAQAISYLKVTNADLAIVANYGGAALDDQRLPNFVRDKHAEFHWQPQPLGTDWPFPDLLQTIQKACYRVHFVLGPGFLHQVYRRAVMIELQRQQVGFEYLKVLPITYKGQVLGQHPVRVLLVNQCVLLTTFAVKCIEDVMIAQLKAYLRQLRLNVGIFANFHGAKMEFRLVRVTG